MSYQYGAALYCSAADATKAAVEDFLYAGGNNGFREVAEFVASECVDELVAVGWGVPGWSGDRVELLALIEFAIAEARALVLREDLDDDEVSK